MPTLLSHPWAIGFRNLLRQSDIARSVYRYWMTQRDYEENFSRQLLRAVGPSTVVWDIGANVGLYTTQFLERGAPQVICFEPAPAAVRVLQQKFGPETGVGKRVQIVPVALSDQSGTASFIADDTAVTNRLAAQGEPGAVQVRVERADRLIAEAAIPRPHVIKVDVEGFELEVLTGCGTLLQSP
ncbi:MAG TPA: FkbM family methyltransferase, partial [Burkholderiales bacterium]|nr:FkbM family methyltransferase [Burkholderiales bacterium]